MSDLALGAAASPVSSLAQIRELVRDLPGPDLEASSEAAAREGALRLIPGGLGRLAETVDWLARWQGRYPPRLERPRISVFAGSHGVLARGVSVQAPESTAALVQRCIEGDGAINQLAAFVDADLRVYELALEHPCGDFTQGPALSEEDCLRAMAYGMMAVEPGIDLLCLGDLGAGNTTAAAALACGAFGGTAADWTGPGAGVCADRLAHKIEVVAAGVARHRAACADGLDWLCAVGGHELAAIAGAVLAARLAQVPVVLDSYPATAAAAMLVTLDRGILDHCAFADLGPEPGHARLLDHLGRRPLLTPGLTVGQGIAAALAIPLLRGAIACFEGTAATSGARPPATH